MGSAPDDQGLPRNAKATGWKAAEEQHGHSPKSDITDYYQYKARRETLQ